MCLLQRFRAVWAMQEPARPQIFMPGSSEQPMQRRQMRWKVFLIGFAKRITHKETSAQESLSILCAGFSNVPFIGPKFCALLIRNGSKYAKTAFVKYIDNSVYFFTFQDIFATKLHASQAVGGGFESRHPGHEKRHDITLEIAFASWLYLLHIGLKQAGKCDRIATNSEKTCFVRLCAPLFCMPCFYIIQLYNGLLYALAMG